MEHKFNNKKKLTFFSQLQSLLRSGLSFSRSFALIIDSSDEKDRSVLTHVFNSVIAGKGLWEAMGEDKSFSTLDIGVVRIGEETGKLHEALDFLSDYYARKEEQKRMIINSLSYPVITLCVAIAVLVFMLAVVVPMFQQVYSRMGGELPSVTMLIIRMSDAIPYFFAFLAFSAAILAMCRGALKNSDSYQRLVSSFILKIPVAGDLVKKYHVSRFCSLMHLMTASGVPVLQALRMMSGIMTFQPFRESVSHICETIEKGGSLTDGVAAGEYLYGKRFVVLMRVGEETSSLERMFKGQADENASELDFGIRQMNNVLEPVLILCIGAIVAFVLIAMYMPMFKLGMTIQ